MSSSWVQRLAIGLVLTALAGGAVAQITDIAPPTIVPDAPAIPAGSAWANKALTPAARAAAVLSAMTLEDKIALIAARDPMTWVSAKQTLPAEALPGAGFSPGVPRLGIPPLREAEGPLGVVDPSHATASDVTALPAGLLTAATFDPDLAQKQGEILGREARIKSFNLIRAARVQLLDDPRRGWAFETLGADPLLAGVMGGRIVQGVQSNKIIGALDGAGPPAGSAGDLALRLASETGKPQALVCRAQACADPAALTAGHSLAPMVLGATADPAAAMSAGLDQYTPLGAGADLAAQLRTGSVGPTRIDQAARDILTALFASGAVDTPLYSPNQIDREADRDLALQIAQQGIVLLANKPGVLPLAKGKTVGIIGLTGVGGVLAGGGASLAYPAGTVSSSLAYAPGSLVYSSSVLNALEDEDVTIRYNPLDAPADAAAFSRTVDVPVIFANQWRTDRTDLTTLALPGGQDAMITAVAAANPNTVVVLQTGGPVLTPWADQVGAVIQAWYPGIRGGQAIADILTGKVNPSGRLPIAFPSSDAPAAAPRFAFGHGLTYSAFRYGGLSVTGGANPSVRFTLTNTSRREGTETAQLYLTAAGGQPHLAGWARVTLKAGQSRSVTLPVRDLRAVAGFDAASGKWSLAGGAYQVAVGPEAGMASLSGQMTLTTRSLTP